MRKYFANRNITFRKHNIMVNKGEEIDPELLSDEAMKIYFEKDIISYIDEAENEDLVYLPKSNKDTEEEIYDNEFNNDNIEELEN